MTFLSAVSFSTAVLAAPMQDGAATAPLSRNLVEHASARTVAISLDGQTLGMGVIISQKGLAITPGEVAFDVKGKPHSGLRAKLEGSSHPIKVVAYDSSTDLALVELPDKQSYPYVELADRVSSTVVLVVLPSGASRGHIAVMGVPGVIAMTGRFMPLNEIRLDSGGRAPTGSPIFLPDGRLAGLISAELESDQPSPAPAETRMLNGFAAKLGPIKPATTFSPDLTVLERVIGGFRSETKSIDHPWIGLFFKTAQAPLLGAEITEVAANSPAADARIRVGDIVIGSPTQAFRSHIEFAAYLFGKKPGETLSLSVSSEGRVRTVRVRLAREPHATGNLFRSGG